MKLNLFLMALVCCLGFSSSSFAEMDLEMSSQEYQALLNQQMILSNTPLSQILNFGKRNLDWLIFINSSKPADQKLSFSSKETQMGYPIDHPTRNNPTLIQGDLELLKTQMPPAMAQVIFENSPFPAALPISEADYLEWGRKMDRIYQRASRWLLQEPYLTSYAARKVTDIRGYYFLSREIDLENRLNRWSELPSDIQTKYKGWLLGACLNAMGSDQLCQSAWNSSKNYFNFWKSYETKAKAKYDSFFVLQNARSEGHWDSGQVFALPFEDPKKSEIWNFLESNIEDEWRLNDWHLDLQASSSGSNAHVEFVAGATPHVNGLGGDTITMDANQPLTEYNVQWTIRHEFGHVLGLPDCYVEFYDSALGEMISYQIDITNLMCSRKGHILQTHVDELKRAYH